RPPDPEAPRPGPPPPPPAPPPQHAHGVTHVPHRVFQQRRPDFVSSVVLDAFDAAELDHRLAPRLVGVHAGPTVLLGLLIDVEANLFAQPAFERAAMSHRTQPLPVLGYPAHKRLSC